MKKVLSITAVLALATTLASAQTMFVKPWSGKRTEYVLGDVEKFTFDDGSKSMTVTKKDNSTNNFVIADTRHVKFSDVISGLFGSDLSISDEMFTYPNPVENELNIDLSDVYLENAFITILTLEGVKIMTEEVLEADLISIDLTELPEGVYICRFSNEEEIRSVRIIKE